MTDVPCAVPGCNNSLTEEQRSKKISVCSECEAANMHTCESCGKRIDTERIKNGASICRECEANPSGLEGSVQDYDDEYMMETGSEGDFMSEESDEEDFMV